MNPTARFFTALVALNCLFISAGYSQYYPGSGYGMGRGGMGRGMTPQASGPSRPQIPNIAGDIANKETKWLKENLGLDKDQAKAVKKLNNEYADIQQDAIKDIVGTGTQPTADTRKQIQDMMLMLNEEKEDKLKGLLTPEQWTTYQAKKESMQKEVGGFRPPAPKGTAARTDSTGSPRQ